MKSMVKLSVIASVTALLSACSPQPENAEQSVENQVDTPIEASTTVSESERLADFFASTFEQDLRESPMSQSYLGIKWDYDKWDDISNAKTDARMQTLRERLAMAQGFDASRLNANEQLSLRIFIMSIERQLANDAFRLHTYIMQQMRGYHTMVPSFLINIHRVNDISDAEAYISRLEGVKPMFDQVIQQLRLREEAGIFPPYWSYDQMIQSAFNVVQGNPFIESADDSTIWADFQQKVTALEISNAEKAGLLARGQEALISSVQPAYAALIEELRKQQTLTPQGDGVWRLPEGDKWYQNRLEWFTTTDLNAEQIHQLGLENVERIHNAMRNIMAQVNFEGTLQEFFEFMRNDDQFYYPDTDEGREQYMRDAKAYIDTMRDKIPDYFGLIPQADMIIKRVEPFRERSAGKAFYQSPAHDGSRPGIYYANLFNMRDMPTYQMEALAYHEGIPGHHMQRAITQELEGIPDFQKYVSFTAYTEGWGLYTEELGKDMGFYADPYSDFGRLAMELWRACRLVVDTGIHAKQWSREQAIEYLIENTPNPQNDAVKAIERYIAMPGQATAYMIGKLKIIALREKAMAELGDKFDWRGFHDEILKDGPVPLSILEEKLNRWIASQK
ncbi:DUF885 domain-containing protein [Alteromonas sp. ASW11-36]|uniref:DUF885 domain-containing protein n=1 Tax=Alteromonas arenosi TaxID=3055817 RepID=A0ABT7SV07_9ALTE|nr:DUF885 domain-containing protein [Alteromonas sp. ASW11-36]MDM7859995.1 DUF885 domain-containing protein [Alteromonas sp. ASW11-36]